MAFKALFQAMLKKNSAIYWICVNSTNQSKTEQKLSKICAKTELKQKQKQSKNWAKTEKITK